MSAIEADDGDVEAVRSSGKGGDVVMVFVVLLDVVTGGGCVGGLSVISVESVDDLFLSLGSELQANIRSL